MPIFEIEKEGKTFEVDAPSQEVALQGLGLADKPTEPSPKEPAEPMGRLERLGYGFMNPVYGAAQIGARTGRMGVMADDPTMAGLETREQEEERIGQVDKTVRERDKKYQERTKDLGFDWMGLAGEAANPLTYFPGALFGPLGAGAQTGLVQPVTGENFALEKGTQVGVGTATGGAFKLAGKGVEAVGRYVAREWPEAIENKAIQRILRRIQSSEKAGGPSATDSLELINEANAQGKPMTLADTGKGVTGLAGNVARRPGEPSQQIAESFLTQRDAAARERIESDISKYVHSGPSLFSTTEAMLQARSAASRLPYEEMEKLQGIWSFRLSQFLDDPVLKTGMSRGYEIERLHSLAEGRPFNPTQLGVDLDQQGNIKFVEAPNMRVLDMGKRGLDAMIADERDPLTGRLTARGVGLEKVRRAYVEELDSLDTSGKYKAARTAWAGYSRNLDAMRQGSAIFAPKTSAEEVAADFAKLSEGEQEFYRLGVADAMRERLSKTGLSGDEAKAILKNQWMQDKLKPVFKSEEDFNKFVKAVASERSMFETKVNVLKGSQTAERVAEDTGGDAALQGMDIGRKAFTGHYLSAIRSAISMWRDIGMKSDPKVNEAVAKILFSPGIDVESQVGKKLTGQVPLTAPQAIPKTVAATRATAPVATVGATEAIEQP